MMKLEFFKQYSPETRKDMLKVFTDYLLKKPEVRARVRVLLAEEEPEKEITEVYIDRVIKKRLVPSYIEDGTAEKMVREYERVTAEETLKTQREAVFSTLRIR